MSFVSLLYFYASKQKTSMGEIPRHADYTTPRFRYILYTLYTYTYILVCVEYYLRHDKLTRLKCF